jgi:cytochrome P450
MSGFLFHLRRLTVSYLLEALLRFKAWRALRAERRNPPEKKPAPVDRPQTPEDFRPLEDACFQNPYAFYKMLRDDYPVYKLANGIHCISRYEDIVNVARDTDRFSSKHQGAMLRLQPWQSIAELSDKLDALGDRGVLPSGVLATTDPPEHRRDRKIGQSVLNPKVIKDLEGEVESLTRELMDGFINDGNAEFMHQFAWRLPMRLVIRILGLPKEDLLTVKRGCVSAISLLSGSATRAELLQTAAVSQGFFRYCWRAYLKAKRQPGDHLVARFAAAAADPTNNFSDQHAVSAMHQLLIAGSDSSATTMGNAVKMMLENPQIERQLRDEPERIPAFVEEVLRLDSAFQGHFRWAKTDCELHGVMLPRGSRVFLMWASGNRDERFWDNPDAIDLARENGRKHLTFGHGIHGCLGRELARMEIRTVLRELLARTSKMKIVGDTPFIASMFARTLVQLPIEFSLADHEKRDNDIEQAA